MKLLKVILIPVITAVGYLFTGSSNPDPEFMKLSFWGKCRFHFREMMKKEMMGEEWHRKYKQVFIDNGVDEEFAEECLQAGMGGYDYNDNPEDCALSEMSYWDS